MKTVKSYNYNEKDVLGKGSFGIVYKGKFLFMIGHHKTSK